MDPLQSLPWTAPLGGEQWEAASGVGEAESTRNHSESEQLHHQSSGAIKDPIWRACSQEAMISIMDGCAMHVHGVGGVCSHQESMQ